MSRYRCSRLGLLACALVVACRDGSPIPPVPGIAFITPAGTTDTIGTSLPLRVVVRDSALRPIADAEVQLTPLILFGPRASLGTANGILIDTTDANGAMETIVRLGSLGGEASIQARVASLGMIDTVRFMIEGRSPSWSPDGQHIVYLHEGRLWLYTWVGGAKRALTAPGRDYRPGLSWSPDSKWVFATFDDPANVLGVIPGLVEVSTGVELPITNLRNVGSPRWKP